MPDPPGHADTSPTRPTTRWLGRGTFALLDQGLYAAGQFAVQILLARLLPETDYGAFAVAYALLILVGALHRSFLTEPMMVFGSGRYHRRLPAYLHQLLRSHLKLTAAFAVIMLGGAALAYSTQQSALAEALAAFSLAQLVILLPWMLRDAAYIDFNPRSAATASALYCVTLVAGLAALQALGMLRIASAVAVMAAASAIACAHLIRALHIPLKPAHPQPARFRPALARHRRYGKWAAPTNLIRFLPEHFPFLILPVLLSYADNAGYKAMNNLTVPFVLFTASMSALALPALVRKRNDPGFNRLLTILTLGVALPPLLAWPLIAGLAHWHIPLIYGNKFLDDIHLLWVLGTIPVAAAVHTLLHAAFKAAEQPQRVFPCAAAACLVLLTACWPMTHHFDLTGMALTVLAAHLTQAAVALLLIQHINTPKASTMEPRPI
ncbi:MAG: oligosaccharide flippase family protein [Planctomycetota bacterium]